MATIDEARDALGALGLPKAEVARSTCYCLLAMCGLKPGDPWSAATNMNRTLSKGIIDFLRDEHGKTYAPNSRETVRKDGLHVLERHAIVVKNPDNPGLATNSQNTHYKVTDEALVALQNYGLEAWAPIAHDFVTKKVEIVARLAAPVNERLVRVEYQSTLRMLSPGPHNELQAAILREYAGRHADRAKLLYLGDTAKKDVVLEASDLESIGIAVSIHDQLTDVLLYQEEVRLLHLVEACSSGGPMSETRLARLRSVLSGTSVDLRYVTAFADRRAFRKWSSQIAWGTQVWIADEPEHIVIFR